jgi:hypothetical protein
MNLEIQIDEWIKRSKIKSQSLIFKHQNSFQSEIKSER